MKIKDTTGNTCIEFTNFTLASKNDIDRFVNVIVNITLNHFNAKTKITAELWDFESMIKGFEISYKTLDQTFYFQHLDQRLKIKFSTGSTGRIQVSGTLYDNALRQTYLTFEFYSDQTFIPDMIKECQQDIESLNPTSTQ